MTDPVADLLTRIRNALRVRRPSLDVPHSGLREAVVAVLKREGFVREFQVVEGAPRSRLRIQLRYGPRGDSAINEITRVSVPGRRIYRRISEVPPIAGGIGIAVL
ncbi:MAG: 30S ribosomal protein S8, partial [Planctomycetales bacterium]|nr:30S ribosomal protein S8 [Planctomycetales bacterium]